MLGAGLALAPAAYAEETVQPLTSFDVNGGSVTTPTLVAGRRYRLEVGGTFQEIGPNVTFDHDSAYCYGDNNPTPICRGDESLSQTGLWARYGSDSAGPFYELSPADPPAYSSNHLYDTTFVAAQSAPLTLLANTPELNRDYVGQLAVALYAELRGEGLPRVPHVRAVRHIRDAAKRRAADLSASSSSARRFETLSRPPSVTIRTTPPRSRRRGSARTRSGASMRRARSPQSASGT